MSNDVILIVPLKAIFVERKQIIEEYSTIVKIQDKVDHKTFFLLYQELKQIEYIDDLKQFVNILVAALGALKVNNFD